MRKKKTSKKREFSWKDIKGIELKPGIVLKEYDPKRLFRDRAFVARALIECLQDGDSEAFKEILWGFLNVVNKTKFAAETKIPERTLYRMVSKKGNPTLDNIARVVHALSA